MFYCGDNAHKSVVAGLGEEIGSEMIDVRLLSNGPAAGTAGHALDSPGLIGAEMDHADHVALLRDGVPGPGGVWADLGSGTGAFTLALAELIGPTGHIYSVDKDAGALREQRRALRARFPELTVHYLAADFARPLDVPPLDGVVMANALHFQREKDRLVQLVHGYLRPGGRFILVEYNVDYGNPWVPYPLSYGTWETLARRNGFANTWLLATRPSRFLGEIYSTVSW